MSSYVSNGHTTPVGVNSKDAVKEMQRKLNAQGAELAVDGIWGPKTQAAYQSSQASKNGAYSGSQAVGVGQAI